MTWNLRFDAQPDNISVEKTLASLSDPLEPPPFMKLNHERPWSARRIPVVQQILNEGVIIVGEFDLRSRLYGSEAEIPG